MRNLIKILTVLGGLLMFTVQVRAQTSDDDALRLARQVATNLNAGKYAEVVALFDDAMNKALTKDQLQAGWESTVKPLGDYQSEVSHTIQTVQDYKVVVLTLQFKNGALDVKTVFNTKGQLSGLNLVPNTKLSPTATPPAYAKPDSFMETDIKINAGTAWELPGTLAIPKGDGKFPVVVLIQGSGPSDRNETIGPNMPFRDIAWGLASQGIAVLRYDKRTFVYGGQSVVKGMTVKDEYVDDAVAAVDLLSKTDKIDPKKIFVLGHSEGGLVAPRIAAATPNIAGVVFAAGLTNRSFETLILTQLQYIASLNAVVPPELQQMIDDAKALIQKVNALTPQSNQDEIIFHAPASYWLDLRGYDAIKAASQLKIPLLVAQGERDYQVTMDDFKATQQGLAGYSDVTFKSYPTLNHLFIAGVGKITPQEYAVAGSVDATFISDVAIWIKAH